MKAPEPSAGPRQPLVDPVEPPRKPPLRSLAPLEPSTYRELVRRALEEDVGAGDITTEATVRPSARARGIFLAKAACIVAGLDVAFEALLVSRSPSSASSHATATDAPPAMKSRRSSVPRARSSRASEQP